MRHVAQASLAARGKIILSHAQVHPNSQGQEHRRGAGHLLHKKVLRPTETNPRAPLSTRNDQKILLFMQDIVGTPRREFYAHWRHESKAHHPKKTGETSLLMNKHRQFLATTAAIRSPLFGIFGSHEAKTNTVTFWLSAVSASTLMGVARRV